MADEMGLRCSDAEREATIARLRDAASEGRLQLEELAERVEAAYGAATRGDLDRLVDDLPGPGSAVAPAAGADPAPARPARRHLFGIMGGDSLSGPMRLAAECRVINVMGSADLDLTQAVLDEGEVTIRIFSLMGGSTLRVPQGVHVDHSGFAFMGGDDIEPAEENDVPGPGAPVVRIRALSIMGGNEVKRGPPRRRRRRVDHGGRHELPPS